MKKIVLLLLISISLKSQIIDSSYIKRLNTIQLNLDRQQYTYQIGIMTHGVGLMADIMAGIGYKARFIDKNDAVNVLIVGGLIHLTASCIMIYSHKYLRRIKRINNNELQIY